MKNKVCLSIETTGSHLGLALHRFGPEPFLEPLGFVFLLQPTKQSATLFPELVKLLRKHRLKRSHITHLAVDVGPGSFTGVRVGVSAARALAQGLKLPLAGIPSLAAIAWERGDLTPFPFPVIPWLPAHSGEVYMALYKFSTSGIQEVLAPTWRKEVELKELVSKNKQALVVSAPPHPLAVGELAIRRFWAQRGNRFDYREVEPLYLQPSWAERKPVRLTQIKNSDVKKISSSPPRSLAGEARRGVPLPWPLPLRGGEHEL